MVLEGTEQYNREKLSASLHTLSGKLYEALNH